MNSQEVLGWRGATVFASDGDKIGKVEDIYLDNDTSEPEWLAVRTGLFGSRSSFVPLQGATSNGDGLTVPFEKGKVKDAPNVEADGRLSPEEEAELYRYYGIGYSAPEATTTGTGGNGHDTSGPDTDEAMTRSEEQLRVGKTTQEAGRVRLRKWVDTERVSETVPVAHEEVRIEREPITDGNVDRAMDGPAISEEEHEIVLTEERVVAETEAVPVERVRLQKETVVEDQEVAADLRKERIETEGTGVTGSGSRQ